MRSPTTKILSKSILDSIDLDKIIYAEVTQSGQLCQNLQ